MAVDVLLRFTRFEVRLRGEARYAASRAAQASEGERASSELTRWGLEGGVRLAYGWFGLSSPGAFAFLHAGLETWHQEGHTRDGRSFEDQASGPFFDLGLGYKALVAPCWWADIGLSILRVGAGPSDAATDRLRAVPTIVLSVGYEWRPWAHDTRKNASRPQPARRRTSPPPQAPPARRPARTPSPSPSRTEAP